MSHDKIKQINRLVAAAHGQISGSRRSKQQLATACDYWLQAWELVKQLATAEMRTLEDFEAAYPALELPLVGWLSQLEMELHNAGLDDPHYFEERIRFVHERLAHFPDVDGDTLVTLRRAEGEALWLLGRREEAEAVYQALVKQLPDHAWGYIGWSDQYYLVARITPKDYPRAETILLQALKRPKLDDHLSVLERLVDMYEDWGKPEKMLTLAEEFSQILEAERIKSLAEKARRREYTRLLEKIDRARTKLRQTPGRNDPCWCGSGKKYKQCHWKRDRRQYDKGQLR